MGLKPNAILLKEGILDNNCRNILMVKERAENAKIHLLKME
jgi:hypothetical protein